MKDADNLTGFSPGSVYYPGAGRRDQETGAGLGASTVDTVGTS